MKSRVGFVKEDVQAQAYFLTLILALEHIVDERFLSGGEAQISVVTKRY